MKISINRLSQYFLFLQCKEVSVQLLPLPFPQRAGLRVRMGQGCTYTTFNILMLPPSDPMCLGYWATDGLVFSGKGRKKSSFFCEESLMIASPFMWQLSNAHAL